MSESQPKQTRKIWQPLNRKSQILATIAAIAVLAFQIYSWHSHSSKARSLQTQPAQQVHEKQHG